MIQERKIRYRKEKRRRWKSSKRRYKRKKRRRKKMRKSPWGKNVTARLAIFFPSHYGTKPGRFEISNHSLSHELGKKGVSERVNKCAQLSARAKKAVQSKRMSERCGRMSERSSVWPSTYVPNLGCFKTTCHGLPIVVFADWLSTKWERGKKWKKRKPEKNK